ncbi:expressed unknown protein [Seminavis robusta]|uniref:Uncharacterized protein n=1 Tax=Seminavis robusta TaxID=568900 RepID=A0A9N8HJX8_9STRA|nr:expressed unknown protein [Seminavis robusta]|eukprot:Sro896_g217380.1 n/a (398) ;mRNA; r:28058-29358
MSSSVWIRLYYRYNGKDEPEAQPVEIDPIPKNIAALAEAVKAKMAEELTHCSAAKLVVYKSGTTPSQDSALNVWDPVPSNSSGPQPLIVVAPGPKQADDHTDALARIERKLDDMATVDVPMSEATSRFASSLLEDLKVKITVLSPNTNPGEGKVRTYPWGENEHETEGQPGCKQILEEEILPLFVNGQKYALYDVRSQLLRLKAGKRKSNGFSDLAVGPQTSMSFAETSAKDLMLSYTDALVELKRAKSDLKPGPLLLRLVSLSEVSENGQGVVVLGTDCATKWRLLHFSDYNRIMVQPYTDGKKCIADFKTLMEKCTMRKGANVPPEKSATIHEDTGVENEIEMAEFGIKETAKDGAIARETKLRKFASALEYCYGETLEVPAWAKASESCRSYFV